MADIRTFDLPDLGEGLTDGEILRWLVAPGDTVTLNQPIVEVETAKAAVEIPSPYAGVVTALHHEEGATVEVGSPLIAIDTAPGAASPPSNDPSHADSDATTAAISEAPPSAEPDAEIGGRTPVLVGYGPRSGPARRRARRATPEPENAPAIGGAGLSGDRAEPAPDETLPLLPTIPDALAAGAKPVRHGGLEMGRAAERAATAAGTVTALPVSTATRTHPASTTRPRAKPPVRKLARDLGVDLATVPATGPDGTVSRDDVQRAASASVVTAEPAQAAPEAGNAREQRIPVRGVRKLTAEAMVTSVATAPHVTEWLTVDVTRTLRAVRRLRANPAFADVRVGPLLLVAKAVLLAVRRRPELNSSWVDGPDGAEIVLKDYVNLGIAAATPRGLIVPNIKDAGRLPLPELASALDSLVTVAKSGKTPPADLSGGTLTITNVGVFGVDAGTPILNPGEAAILCVGQIAERPWVHRGVVKPRAVCQLALSFDHRIVDGEGGSRFLADIGRFLTDPEGTALAWS
ncbi:dihydrolipoamide acetyltransferase family protein [Cryptosporangium aurantiacum]|uniref:Dihydrolipoamide acetyltransferase component of pyruvate dehydrogenase complex n=1 Tax=Cryptosporangium aurantiacum TaxID=134849 RepID=A0A1M7RLE6_9ACTN|nr:dihydrolipoamide acetyltransferase family protein [Cryptosporangium aurantiacum]SHN46898.1 pyruvate dehydrogenase E2 component (dihydrolipoamide acetyltransferase) [Cryptosporangium aurantiacum]